MSIKEHITVGEPKEINPGEWTCAVTWSGPSCKGSQLIAKHRSTHYEAKQDAEILARRIAAQEKTAVNRGDMPKLPPPKFDPSELKELRDALDAEKDAKAPPITPANLAAKAWADTPVSLHTSTSANFDLALLVGDDREWVVSLGRWEVGIPIAPWRPVQDSWATSPVWTGTRSQFNYMRSKCETPYGLLEMAKKRAGAGDQQVTAVTAASYNDALQDAERMLAEHGAEVVLAEGPHGPSATGPIEQTPEQVEARFIAKDRDRKEEDLKAIATSLGCKRDELQDKIASLRAQVNKEAAEANHYSALVGQLREKVKDLETEIVTSHVQELDELRDVLKKYDMPSLDYLEFGLPSVGSTIMFVGASDSVGPFPAKWTTHKVTGYADGMILAGEYSFHINEVALDNAAEHIRALVDEDNDELDRIRKILAARGILSVSVANAFEAFVGASDGAQKQLEEGGRRSKEMALQLKRAQAMRDSWKASASESMGRHRDTAIALALSRAVAAAYRVTSD